MITLSPETERLARLVGAQTGKTPEQVIHEALEAQARMAGVAISEPREAAKKIDLERVRAITGRVASRPLIDKRSEHDILDEAWGR